VFEDEVPEMEVPAKEAALARGLVEASLAEKFDFGTYKDTYTGGVLKMLESKAGRRGLKRSAAASGEEQPAVTNLMDALRESLRQVKKNTGQRKRRATQTRALARPRRKPR
jgi:non-homologous end joining protein Ku